MLSKYHVPKGVNAILILLFLMMAQEKAFSQAFTPVPISGFNQDVVAESGTSSLVNTSMAIDGVASSNKVIYTNAFRVTNGFGGGGLPDNGTITDAAGSYQLAAYNASNVLLLPRSQSGDLTLSTPAKFNTLRLLCFSAEGASTVTINLFFTDGSNVNAVTNYNLADWFPGTTNIVLQGFGRCTRATPASGAEGWPTNPKMYYINIPLSCANRNKLVQRVNITNTTTTGNNAPYPNAVFLALSGVANTQNITPTVTNATCTVNGSATLNITGVPTPFTVSWNTVPVQTGITATNLAPGNYQATITDANACVTVVPVTITRTNNLTMTAHIDTTICPGASFNANTVSNAASYSWSPTTGVSNPGIANPVLTPPATTPYTITGTTGACTISKTFTVTVQQAVTLTLHIDTTICNGASFSANTVSNAANYSWTPSTGLSNAAIANPTISPAATTTYTVVASTGNCSLSKFFTVTVLPSVTVSAGSGTTIIQGQSFPLQGSGSAGTYLWTPATGLNATNILNPIAKPAETTNYTLKITSPQGCSRSASVLITVIPNCANPMNAFTPNGDGFNDKWLVTNGNCIIRVKVYVYNRYGSRVFESLDYKNDWDGTYKGSPLPDGTYYYVITYTLINNDFTERRGNVTILR